MILVASGIAALTVLVRAQAFSPAAQLLWRNRQPARRRIQGAVTYETAIAYCTSPGLCTSPELGWQRFPRNLPTNPAGTLQLPEGREPILQQGATGAPARLLPTSPLGSRVSGGTQLNKRRTIDLCALRLLEEGSVWSVGHTFSAFSNDDMYGSQQSDTTICGHVNKNLFWMKRYVAW